MPRRWQRWKGAADDEPAADAEEIVGRQHADLLVEHGQAHAVAVQREFLAPVPSKVLLP